MSATASPYQLLEMNVISAQNLAPISKSIKAYAVAWLNPERKLATEIDQVGHTNPTWNEKFVFRVDDQFLEYDNSVIMIEIYASARLRDVLIGTVAVLVSNFLPPSSRSRKPKLRFLPLQIRRPSGRPQGILNIGVTLLDSTMRSMPLYSQLSASAVGYRGLMESDNKRKKADPKVDDISDEDSSDSELLTLQRCLSEKSDSTINDYTCNGKQGNSYYYDDAQDSDVGMRKGVSLNEESLCFDVGPSPSVVAAAIAKGWYPLPAPPVRTVESSTVDGWSENNSAELMNTKIERWRAELTPAYEVFDEERAKLKQTPKRVGQTPKRKEQRGGLFSCFGTALGCEISVSCGEGNKRRRNGKGDLNTSSELTFDQSFV
ncbi:hypothetical protein VNO77_18527 [Canavalia gladiata]|uniref:C2 domain-containing protein n=1 Tax=Canavalia gladiata TaxID=3824 RepID=A0AAN9LKZ3_CANGL